MRLEIGHQEGCRDAFAANVADHQPKLIAAELEKIVVIATYVAGLDTNGCVFQGGKSGMCLWEEPRLDVPGELQFLAQAMFGLRPFGMGAALCFDLDVDGIITQKREGVSIQVFEASGDCAPGLHLWRMVKTHAVLAPFLELGEDVFGQEDDLSRAADKLVFSGADFRNNEREHSGAIGGSDGERIFDGRERDIKGQAESQLIQVESPAALFVANENGYGSEAEVGVVAIRAKTAPVRKHGRRVSSGHREQYSAWAVRKRSRRLFVAEAGDGVEVGGEIGGIIAEEETYAYGHGEAYRNPPVG